MAGDGRDGGGDGRAAPRAGGTLCGRRDISKIANAGGLPGAPPDSDVFVAMLHLLPPLGRSRRFVELAPGGPDPEIPGRKIYSRLVRELHLALGPGELIAPWDHGLIALALAAPAGSAGEAGLRDRLAGRLALLGGFRHASPRGELEPLRWRLELVEVRKADGFFPPTTAPPPPRDPNRASQRLRARMTAARPGVAAAGASGGAAGGPTVGDLLRRRRRPGETAAESAPRPPPPPVPPLPPPPPATAVAPAVPAATGRPGSMLLVDDDEVVADLIAFYFRRDGWRVRYACGGPEALEMAAEEVPDVFVLDVMMPGMDGFEVLETIRDQPRFGAAAVLLLTAQRREADILRAFDLGADDYLVKPFAPEELMARVARFVRPAAHGA